MTTRFLTLLIALGLIALPLAGCPADDDDDSSVGDDDDATGDDDDATSGDDDDVVGDDDDDTEAVAGDWRDVSVGVWVSCAVDTVGDLSCWSTDTVADWYPPVPTDLDFVGVSAGLDIACAWNSEGDTRCFGQPQGTENNPAPGILEQPGIFDPGTVRCGAAQCCGVAGSDLSCWDASGSVSPSGLDAATGLQAVALWGPGCTLGLDGSVDCFTFSSTGGPDPGAPIDDLAVETLDVGDGGYACARSGEVVGCWDVLEGSGTVESMDVPAGVTLTDLQSQDNGGVPYVCGLAGGAVACYGTAAFAAPTVSAPSGNWTHLSMRGGVGCVLAGQSLSCWGTGEQRPR